MGLHVPEGWEDSEPFNFALFGSLRFMAAFVSAGGGALLRVCYLDGVQSF